jgi:hypothetical protein
MDGGRFLLLDHLRAACAIYDAAAKRLGTGQLAEFANQSAANERKYAAEVASLQASAPAIRVSRPVPLVIGMVAPGRPGFVRLTPGLMDPAVEEFHEYDFNLKRTGGGKLRMPARAAGHDKVPVMMSGRADSLAFGYRDGTVAMYKV